MVGCRFIHTSPDRPNLIYDVRIRTDIETDMQPIVNILRKYLINMLRMIVYCQSLNSCADLYAHFHHELQEIYIIPMVQNPSVITAFLLCFMQIPLKVTVNNF